MMNQRFKFLTFLAMLYLTIDLVCLAMTYKMVHIFDVYTSVEILVFPLTYTLTDIVTEVYGYAPARAIVWQVFICDFLFSMIALMLNQVPAVKPAIEHSYVYVFNSLWRGSLAESVGVLAGIFMNIYVISRLKVIVRGRYFWLRSIGSSAAGELILLLISIPILFVGRMSWDEMYKVMLSAYAYKIVFAIVISGPAALIVDRLKKHECLNVFDRDQSFNPFKLSG